MRGVEFSSRNWKHLRTNDVSLETSLVFVFLGEAARSCAAVGNGLLVR
jgi:hypothetical protein